MSALSERDAKQVEAALESMAEDLAELVGVYGLGSAVVRVLDEGKCGALLTARAHSRPRGGTLSPEELVSVRKRVKP